MKKFGLVLAGALAFPLIVTGANAEVSKYGITVNNCGFDYDDEDFCTDKRLKTFSQVLKKRKPNFDRDKIIYIFESSNLGYRLVIMNKKTKVVSPMRHALLNAMDSRGNLKTVNSKGDNIEFDFNVNSNRFCFKGNIEAYKDSYGYESGPFCYKYDSKFDTLTREY